jgi:hypothetical protein
LSQVGDCVRVRLRRRCRRGDGPHALQRDVAADHNPQRRRLVRARTYLAIELCQQLQNLERALISARCPVAFNAALAPRVTGLSGRMRGVCR